MNELQVKLNAQHIGTSALREKMRSTKLTIPMNGKDQAMRSPLT